MADWKEWYPRLVKYNTPVKEVKFNGPDGEGTDYEVSFEEVDDWVKTLPGDWPERFSSVMGSVTCCGTGFFLCDISDTLYALEKGWEFRGGY